MAATTEKSAGATAIRPFKVEIPQEEIDELRRRLRATRWPEKETVADESQGVQLATMQELARYWATTTTSEGSRRGSTRFPHFITEIDGVDIHFIHVRSRHENALPVIITHGWPGSIVEMLEHHRPADRPDGTRRRRRGRLPRRGPVDARLRVLGQADRHRVGSGPHRGRLVRADEAPRLRALRGAGRRLGRPDHRHDGREGTAGAASGSTPTCPAPSRPPSPRRSP